MPTVAGMHAVLEKLALLPNKFASSAQKTLWAKLKAQHALRADRAQRLPLDTKWPDDGVYSVRIDRELI